MKVRRGFEIIILKIIISILIGLFLFLLVLFPVNAICTVSLNKEVYSPGEIAVATMSCSGNVEKNKEYILDWYNDSSTIIQSDSGTTPGLGGFPFLEDFFIPYNFKLFIQHLLKNPQLVE